MLPFIIPPQTQCLTIAIYQEAGNQSIAGQLAVGNVILNRAKQRKLTPCQVVRQKGQFSWYPKQNPHLKLQDKHLKHLGVAITLIEQDWLGRRIDNTHGAVAFATLSTHNYWTKKYVHTVTIGNHKFYKEPKK